MRKTSLMIVDDEAIVRSLIRRSVDWDALGVEIAAEAGSGEEALALAASLKPDVMLLDVCMPGMDGIRLAERVLAQRPETRVVVISGHDTFAYAQQCIRLGVKDYLLKPVNEEQLTATVSRIVKELDPEALLWAQSRGAVRDALDFVREHFREADVSLQSVAERFHLNPSYLSRAFGEDTGASFVETLTRLRMEEAARLLRETPLMGYEIGGRVGIPDAKYFGACFKKHTGLTLQEYRREARGR